MGGEMLLVVHQDNIYLYTHFPKLQINRTFGGYDSKHLHEFFFFFKCEKKKKNVQMIKKQEERML